MERRRKKDGMVERAFFLSFFLSLVLIGSGIPSNSAGNEIGTLHSKHSTTR
jgi:hypothetical protein